MRHPLWGVLEDALHDDGSARLVARRDAVPVARARRGVDGVGLRLHGCHSLCGRADPGAQDSIGRGHAQ